MLSILFPEPGGPMSSTLWLPAAATSSARFTFSCPSTSRKSSSGTLGFSGTHAGSSEREISPFRPEASCRTVSTGMMAGPLARVASAAFSAGTKRAFIPSRLAASAIGSTPVTGRIFPSRLTSPKKALSDLGRRTLPQADRMLKRIGRS